jgi:hypothetical protein
MTNKRTLLLIDSNIHHHDIFRDAIANAIDGPSRANGSPLSVQPSNGLKRTEYGRSL